MSEQAQAPLTAKKTVLGVSGGIASYKSIDLARLLALDGAEVRTVLTQSAASFVQPLPFEVLTGRAPIQRMFPIEGGESTGDMPHISLTEGADLIIIAPATANIIGKFAQGVGDDFLSTLLLSARPPVLVAPAMNPRMWASPALQENVSSLRERGHVVMEPGLGRMARAEEGVGRGRMPEPQDILLAARKILLPDPDLSGMKIVVTAGPTREKWDAVRYLSNRSSGKMGFALAGEAARRGADAVLVSGPAALADPLGVRVVRVESAAQMYEAVKNEWADAHALVMAAAVADYRPVDPSTRKRKKGDAPLAVELERTTDILAELGTDKGSRILVGFAAETDEVTERAKEKLERKGLDFIVANRVSGDEDAMGADTSRAWIIDSNATEALPVLEKGVLAGCILDRLAKMWQNIST
ncbi:MAG: bifunctional phosphopantothenoylcysteine decarboxylase/phosphopantothenate--cysteine ligase CoaBC [Nitrospinae bacterium]|nr:bifunctional phosphopantothenoylcysteine decarboxylase/phosphopantothenate--cysteine ligase CoaBC [Nitrospinota bacterium]